MYTGLPVHCQWLIASSLDEKIIIEFDYIFIPISIKEYLHTGCHRGSINLWTVGLKHEKIEICGDRRHVRIGGIGQMLMIELRIIDPTLDVYFLMKYHLIQIPQISSTTSTLLASTTLPLEKHINNRNSLFSECGLTWTNSNQYYIDISSRIVGGRQALAHSYPWQVLLNNRDQFCGASVLNTRWLITAAHCVNGTHPRSLLAEFGVHDRYRIEPSRTSRTIKQIIVHPSYSGKSNRWMNDIALLQLSEPLVFNSFIRPICLSSTNDSVKHGERTIVTGWGSTRGTGSFRYLREVEVLIQSNDQCGLKALRWETNICAGLCKNSTCDACQGDSGGPMILLRNGRWYLVGLISWGFSCAGLGVYTKISYYSEWILQTINNSNTWL
ncbi:unnamed protein product [Rotaria sp. Silwood1]|nr:unnamed protein product [Rotaria sp. Silwood1]CAF1195278.1 unnamed protein product [Rotaria sp. Silwood1]CAF3454727.1 unnamed protein product [Rotaria sp. Silwood1]CAF3468530.1 unnamed protein product [Rotaria sp. Silwood1]CAF3492687.1 unnamed protein product [Rotaria sp. Silwood1]